MGRHDAGQSRRQGLVDHVDAALGERGKDEDIGAGIGVVQSGMGHEAQIADAGILARHECGDVAIPGRAGKDQFAIGQSCGPPGFEKVMHALAHRHLPGKEGAKSTGRRRCRARPETRGIDAQRHAEDAPGLDAILDQRTLGEGRLRNMEIGPRQFGQKLGRGLGGTGPGNIEPAIFGRHQRQGGGRQRRFEERGQPARCGGGKAAKARFLEAVEDPRRAGRHMALQPAGREPIVQGIALAIALEPAVEEFRQRPG